MSRAAVRKKQKPLAMDPERAGRGANWLMFASTVLALAGIMSLFEGVAGIKRSRALSGDAHFVFGNVRTWGWILLVLGILLIWAAFAVFVGSQFFRWFGIGAALLNAVGQLLYSRADSVWALAVFSLNILVVYALAAYGGPQAKQYNR
jgi:GNAT superfamily N-acetyltransferase